MTWNLVGGLANNSFVNNPDHLYDDFFKDLTGKYPSEPGFIKAAADGLSTGASAVKSMLNRLDDKGVGPAASGAGVSSSPIPPSVTDYLNAELASYYGMSKETAYQEALSNTAYQRAVRDMQSAGLNPAVLFGAGKGYTAGGVPFATSASSGGSRGSGSGGSGSGKLFSSGVYNAIATAAGIGGSIVAKGPAKVSAYWVSSNAAKGIMSALDALF